MALEGADHSLETQVDIRELAEKLVRGEISANEYFAAVQRRAERLVEEEAAAIGFWKRAAGF